MKDNKDVIDVIKETEKAEEEKKQENTKKENSEMVEEAKEEKESKKEDSEKAEESKEEKNSKKEDSEKAEESKEEKNSKKEDSKKPEEAKKPKKEPSSNRAVTQSKRITEAQEAAKKNQEETESSVKEEKKDRKGLAIVLGCIMGLVMIAYVAGFAYFSGHYYKDVTINGISVSNMNKATAKNTLDQFYSNYSLTLKTIDKESVVIQGKDIDIQIQLHDDFEKCLKEQKPYIWFVNYFEHHEYQVSADVTWNEDTLEEIYDDMAILKTKNMEKPEDAYVGVKDDKFEIIKEKSGSTIITKTFKEVVETNLKNVQSEVDLKESNCYELPKVYSTDEELQNELKALGKYAECNIALQLDDLELEPGMELYENVLEKKGDSYELSESKVKKYVSQLAAKYNTVDSDRTFTTSFDDRKVKVHGSAFGYQINEEETVKALLNALKAGKSAKVDVVFDEKGISLIGDNDIGDTYIEVNLSEQKVFGYKNGKKIAEGDCVSGKESAGNGTSIGLYKIQDKLSPTVLRGEKVPVTKTVTKKNKKGKKVEKTTTTYEYSYESPVTYWIQFNGGIGLHDAAGWRSQYGGSIYYYNGSHGCVNLPLDLAKTLYENYEIGDPVVVYFWDNENRK